MWPILSGAELVNDLSGSGSAAGGILSEEEQAKLHRSSSATSPTSPGRKTMSR
jgi:hypothetical protein